MFSLRNHVTTTLVTTLLLSTLLLSTAAFAQSQRQPTETIELYRRVASLDRVPVVTGIDLDQDGKLLALGGDDHQIRLWDIERKAFVRTFQQQHQDWVRSVAFSPDRTRLATVCQSGLVQLWDVQSGALLHSLPNAGRGANKIAFHPDGKSLAVCGLEANVRIYDLSTNSISKTLPTSGTNSRTLAFSPDGSLLAVGGRTGVRVWQFATGTVLADLRGDGRRVNAIAFSPDSKKLALGGDGPFITVWNPMDGELLKTLPERPGKTFSLLFCDADTLATGESDNAIRIWNLATLQNTEVLIGHTGTVATMVYEPTKRQLVSGSFDTTLRFWIITNY